MGGRPTLVAVHEVWAQVAARGPLIGAARAEAEEPGGLRARRPPRRAERAGPRRKVMRPSGWNRPSNGSRCPPRGVPGRTRSRPVRRRSSPSQGCYEKGFVREFGLRDAEGSRNALGRDVLPDGTLQPQPSRCTVGCPAWSCCPSIGVAHWDLRGSGRPGRGWPVAGRRSPRE
jgi:hypothetical protein